MTGTVLRNVLRHALSILSLLQHYEVDTISLYLLSSTNME